MVPKALKAKAKQKAKEKGSTTTSLIASILMAGTCDHSLNPLTLMEESTCAKKRSKLNTLPKKVLVETTRLECWPPSPMDIGVKQLESICVEFIKHFGDQSHKISMQAFLLQITYADVEYLKMAPAVTIQKPSIDVLLDF